MEALFQQYLDFRHASPAQLLLMLPGIVVVLVFIVTIAFFVAALVLRVINSRHEHMWQRLNRLWDQDILNVLSGDVPVATFIEQVKPEEELNFIRYLAQYAYRLRGTDLELLSALARPFMPHVLRLLEHREQSVRVWAVNIFGLFGMPYYEKAVLKSLEDPSPLVAIFASTILLAQKKPEYVVQVLSQIHRFDKWNVKFLASLLSSIGTESIPILESIYLDQGKNMRSREVAAEVLKRLNDYAVADAAAALLDTETNLEMVAVTLRLLGTVGQPQPQQQAAVRKLCDSDSEFIRINAMRALRHMSSQADCELFRQALDDPSAWVALQAAQGLKSQGDLASLEQLARSGAPRAMLARQVLEGAD